MRCTMKPRNSRWKDAQQNNFLCLRRLTSGVSWVITDADSPQRAAERQSQVYTTLENTRFAPKKTSNEVRGFADLLTLVMKLVKWSVFILNQYHPSYIHQTFPLTFQSCGGYLSAPQKRPKTSHSKVRRKKVLLWSSWFEFNLLVSEKSPPTLISAIQHYKMQRCKQSEKHKYVCL